MISMLHLTVDRWNVVQIKGKIADWSIAVVLEGLYSTYLEVLSLRLLK